MTTDARADRSIAAALAGSAAASAAVPEADGDPASLAWRWVVGTDALDLYAAQTPDPSWRATCLGAGGALHRARVALAAEGLAALVTPLPEGADSPHLARLVTTGTIAVTADARELYDATEPAPPPVDPTGSALGAAPAGGPDAAPVVVPTARRSGQRRAIVRELVGAARAEGVRLRLVADGADLVGLLHGPDTREAWLRAGCALSAVRLTARRRGLRMLAAAAEVGRPGRRRIGDGEGWLGVGIGNAYVRLRLPPG